MANVEYYMALAQNHNELSKTYANKVTFFLGMAQEHNENDYQYDNEQTTPKA
jgi:hypothetical protein